MHALKGEHKMATKYRTELQAKRAMRKQQNEYQRRAMTAMTIRLHNENDAKVIARIKAQPNQADYIRRLVLEDIDRNGGE